MTVVDWISMVFYIAALVFSCLTFWEIWKWKR